jgi:4-amino-4-deoxy-L-arabinose transferase-like glycosyltransferase
MGDTASYVAPARALAEEGHYVRAPGSDDPEYYRTPGYPVFLAGVYRLVGDSDLVVLIAQAVLSTLTVLIVYVIGARLWSFDSAVVAAALVAVEPLQFAYSGIVATETLDALVLATGALVLIRLVSARRHQVGWAALAGLAFAAATFVRPATYYLPCLLAVPLMLWSRRVLGTRRGLAVIASFLLAYGAPIAVWQLRNVAVVDTWRFNAVEGKNLYLFRGGDVVSHEDGIPSAEARARLRRALGPRDGYRSDGAYYDEMWRRGSELAREHPVDLLLQTPRGLLSVLLVTGRSSDAYGYFGIKRAPLLVHVLLNAALVAFYILTIAGLVAALTRKTDRVKHMLLLLTAGYVLLVSAGPEAWEPAGRGLRLRSPVMPILCLYTAAGLLVLFRALSRARRSDQPIQGAARRRDPGREDAQPGTTLEPDQG